MTAFNIWLNSCVDGGVELYQLDGQGSTAIYVTKCRYLSGHNYYYTSPVYHVWIRGKWVLATLNTQEAYRVWEDRKKEQNNELD